ncbi:ABC transporter permease subunit [Bradyrhizobium sp. WSM 1791]|uniref:ABC transporter permease subunit n=2 Tax=Bradyrhizobium australiense TaxID=2721161 RepID=A0A7Y4LZS6_9BRAD|nr:ABC transporter permease subunit [Bradyrhizobium australiense]
MTTVWNARMTTLQEQGVPAAISWNQGLSNSDAWGSWMVLLGRHGIMNEALLAMHLITQPIRLLNTTLATEIAMIHILLPHMILPIANALRQIDPSLRRAASVLGATPLGTFWQVILPLSMLDVAAGVVLVFVVSIPRQSRGFRNWAAQSGRGTLTRPLILLAA